MKIFLDINVILDVLAKREPWFEDSAAVLSLLETDEFEGIVAAHSVTTLFYLASKHLGQRRATARLRLIVPSETDLCRCWMNG